MTLGESGGTVFVIDGEGNAALRPVKLGSMVDGLWIIESGLKPGDGVIVSNLQKIQPGAPVKNTSAPAKDKPAASAAPPAAGQNPDARAR